ncbi:cobaltochelatase subunit CobN [Mariluticola halotolerans]|uniref:cobaltochelatase subunit CobN n=1 Tax=Mariluticola halotolerans TaxID=2909283 RepID=UPI0026E3BD47|nr:cobaltochelatase subunit CobN [Mariluticola halotolerans]UJQ93211.1 cobaltochelatase subunit CobN [Mariluticola halotolerans]
MHLLAAQAGALQQEGEAIDLNQTPGDIIFASAADSELAAMAGAVDRAGATNVRLANVLKLAHNLSIDLWLENTVRHAKIVVIRLLGGPAYWPYGVAELATLASTGAFKLAFLPGDPNPDPVLLDRSTLNEAEWHQLHALFTAGGPDNMDLALNAFSALANNTPIPSTPPIPFPRFGIWWPGEGIVDPARLGELTGLSVLDQESPDGATAPPPTPDPTPQGGGENAALSQFHPSRPERAASPTSTSPSGGEVGAPAPGEGAFLHLSDGTSPQKPITPILFYRAALEGAGTATLNRLIKTLVRQGLAPVPLVVSSLKDKTCVAFVQATFKSLPPDVILNLTGFALGLDGLADEKNPFAGTDAPILQLIQTGRSETQWQDDSQGLTAKDLAMQIVLPEMDGRIGALIVGHKQEALWHEATQCPLSAYAPDAEGITNAVKLAQNWAKLRQTARSERRVGIVLANYPIRDGRIANGVGYDAPQSTVEILKALAAAGYDLRSAGAATSPQFHPTHAEAAAIDSLPLEGRDAERQGGGRPEGTRKDSSLPLGTSQNDSPDFPDGANAPTPTPDPSPQGGGENAALAQFHPSNSEHAAHPTSTSPSGGEVGAPAPGEGAFLDSAADHFPQSGNALIEALQSGPTNASPERGISPAILPLDTYKSLFQTLPDQIRTQVTTRWGAPETDQFVRADGFHLPVRIFGNIAVMLQPARGYDLDAEASYHDPDLVPPHAYCAAYLWLRHGFGAHALIHNGKHGNLEWLPGKATALDAASYPNALWGALPHLYPFIVNDPGEGTQAKRRTGAVIIDHLVPPLTRAETYGPLKDLEALLDEYYAAAGMDRRRLEDITKRILAFTRDTALDRDINLPDDEAQALNKIDTFLCDLKEAQIRDGLHIFGQSPDGDLERDLIVALARVPRGEEMPGDASLIRALADDLKLGFDPLTANLGDPWTGPKPDEAEIGANKKADVRDKTGAETGADISLIKANLWRTNGDTVERLEALAAALVSGTAPAPEWTATRAVLATVETIIRPRLKASGPNEIKALLDGLDGKFIAPGPSGAPSRGRLDVLPTGRNFYSVDNRAVPTPTAWELGRKSAENLITRHYQDQGNWLKSIALSVWGTANMRTGGDDIAQALALIGAKPKWDPSSLRVSGFEVIPLARLGRPRVDVTLRISGFFRDAFPQLIALFDRAIRMIGALDEPEDQNPIAARMRTDAIALIKEGKSEEDAGFAAGHRIFGSKPGAYGAGLQGLIDSGNWQEKQDLAKAFLNWGQYAYGAHAQGTPEHARFAARLSDIEAVVHNQDNREHDLLDSDDYYQFEGGLTATAEALSGHKPLNYHNDHSRPERPLTRTLEEEISRVMRSRVVNPKWISGVMRHGYKGAFEIIATLDYMFAFAATTGAVKTHHFDLAFTAFVQDEEVKSFIQNNNPHGYDELIAKFREAMTRGFWTPKSNSAYAELEETPK